MILLVASQNERFDFYTTLIINGLFSVEKRPKYF